MAMVLIYSKTGKLVANGDIVRDSRGEEWVVNGWRAPQHPASSGRIYVHPKGASSSNTREFFPSVFGAEFVAESEIIGSSGKEESVEEESGGTGLVEEPEVPKKRLWKPEKKHRMTPELRKGRFNPMRRKISRNTIPGTNQSWWIYGPDMFLADTEEEAQSKAQSEVPSSYDPSELKGPFADFQALSSYMNAAGITEISEERALRNSRIYGNSLYGKASLRKSIKFNPADLDGDELESEAEGELTDNPSGIPSWLVWVGIGVGAYFLWRKFKAQPQPVSTQPPPRQLPATTRPVAMRPVAYR